MFKQIKVSRRKSARKTGVSLTVSKTGHSSPRAVVTMGRRIWEMIDCPDRVDVFLDEDRGLIKLLPSESLMSYKVSKNGSQSRTFRVQMTVPELNHLDGKGPMDCEYEICRADLGGEDNYLLLAYGD